MLRPLEEFIEDPAHLLLLQTVRCLKTPPDDAARAAVERLEDWRPVPELASGHRIGSQLARMLRGLGALDDLPAETQGALRAVEQREFAANFMAQAQRRAVMTALNAAGIRPMLMKGALLESLYYPNDVARTMTDLDVRIAADEYPAAGAALESIGYSRGNHPDTYHTAYIGHDKLVELHWDERAQPPFRPIEGLYDDATPGQLDGGDVLLPRPLAHFLFIIIHYTAKHRMAPGLQPLGDLTLMLPAIDLNESWPELAELSRHAQAQGAVFWTLQMLVDWFDAEVPGELLEALAPPRRLLEPQARAFERRTRDAITLTTKVQQIRDALDRVAWDRMCSDPRSPRIAWQAFVANALAPPLRDDDGRPLKGRLERIAYVVRPARWGRVVRAAAARLSRRARPVQSRG